MWYEGVDEPSRMVGQEERESEAEELDANVERRTARLHKPNWDKQNFRRVFC